MHARLLRALVPTQVMVTMSEIDVVFVEDGAHLEGSS